MQHQNQDLSKGPTAGKTGITTATDAAITSAMIERHIADGKRMQAEAIAAFLTRTFRRLGALLPPRHNHAPAREEQLSRA